MKTRNAFSILTAIVVIIIMATVAVLVTNLAGKIVQTTTVQYRKEQAMLLAKSYTEYAVMAVMSNDRNTSDCIEYINGDIGNNVDNGDGYRVNTRIAYIADGLPRVQNCANVLNASVVTPETALSIIVDVYVRFKDPDSPVNNAPWITYHRRTLQKI